jgi:hypothetical protein
MRISNQKWMVLAIALNGLFAVRANADRVATPTTQQIAADDQMIRETYKDKLAKPGQLDRIALAKELFAEAARSGADTDAQYVLLCKARDLAAGAGDMDLGLKACDQLSANFAVQPAAMEADMFSVAFGAMFTEDDFSAFVAAALQSTDRALKVDDFASATTLLKLAHAAVPKARNSRLAVMTTLHTNEAEAQEQMFKTLQKQLAALNAKPDDANALSAVGSYVCFWNADWDRGLPLLAGGSDPQRAELARQDLQAPFEPEAQAALGDAWFRFAASTSHFERLHIQMRAYDWLQKAAPHLSGLRAAHVQEELKTLDPMLSQYCDWGQIFIAARAALRQHTAMATEVAGGAFGKTTYQELPAAGALLIGFRFGIGKFVGNDTVTQVQAIYETPEGVVLGESRGNEVGGCVEVRARNGYAVGALTVRGGGGLDAVTVTFMKIVGNGLDPSQSYTSNHIGGSGGGETIIDGGGTPIIGIVGKVDSDGHAAGLGAIFLCAPTSSLPDDPPPRHRKSQEMKLTPAP